MNGYATFNPRHADHVTFNPRHPEPRRYEHNNRDTRYQQESGYTSTNTSHNMYN